MRIVNLSGVLRYYTPAIHVMENTYGTVIHLGFWDYSCEIVLREWKKYWLYHDAMAKKEGIAH